MRLSAILIALTLAAPATAQDRYLSFVVATEHFGTDTLNNFNPGLAYGERSEGPWGSEQSWEVGIVYNSYEEIAPFALYSLSWEVARPSERVSLRAGGFVGIAYYERLAEIISAPNVAGYMPIGGLTGLARVDETTDFRFTLLPAGAGIDAIVNFSVARRF